MTREISKGTLALLSLSVLWPAGFAQALPVARLKNTRPVVQVQAARKPAFTVVRERHALQFGDTIRTSARGKADVLFANGTQVAMRENSQIQIVASQSAQSPLVIRVFGALSEVFVRPKGNTRVQTAAAIAAARGTEFLIRLPDENTTVLTVTEGVVDFSNVQGAVVVNEKQQSTARVGEAPTPPVAVDVTGLVEWTADVTQLPLAAEFPIASTFSAPVREALTLSEAGQTDASRAALETLSANTENAGHALTALGLIELRGGRLDTARKYLQDAATRDAQNAGARALLSLALLNLNETAAAREAAREAVRLQSDSAFNQSALALTEFFGGNREEAQRAARRAGQLDALSPLALLLQGRSALAQLQTDDARDYFAQAAAVAPNWPLAHIELGQAYLRLDQLPRAEASFRRALELNENLAGAHAGLALALQRQGQTPAAEAAFARALEIEPGNVMARGNRAALLIEEGKLEEAQRELEAARDDSPEAGQLYIRLSEIALYRGDLFPAQEFARRAVEILPASALAHYQLGRVYVEQERLLQAEQQFRQAVTLDSQLHTARYALGFVRERTERGLLNLSTSLFGPAVIGSPGSSLSVQNLQTPGAEERIQAAIADPTAVRIATRAYGDTEVAGVIGENGQRDFGVSHLRTTNNERGIFGIGGQHRETDGVRANADRSLDRVNVVVGTKAKTNGSGAILLADYERQKLGADDGRDAVPFLAGIRSGFRLPRVIAGFNVQRGERQRTRALLQYSNGKLEQRDSLLSGTQTDFAFPSFNGELRHDINLGRHYLSAGLSAGTRKRHVDSTVQLPIPGIPPFVDRIDVQVKTFQAYVRDEMRLNEKWSLTGEMQMQKLKHAFNIVTISPPGFPPQSSNRSTTVGVPNVVVAYQPNQRTGVRFRARRLFATIRDFQLLNPTDVFLLSYSDLPQANLLDPQASGRSVELEFDHTFRNASFLRLGAFQQNLTQGDINTTSVGPFPRAQLRGARASYEGLLGRDLAFFLRTDFTSAKDQQLNTYIPHVPRFAAVASLQYLNPSGFFVQPLAIYQSSRINVNTSGAVPIRERRGGFGLFNLRVGKRHGLRSSVFVEVVNIFDKTYDNFDRLQTGRQFRIGAVGRF